MSNQRNEIVLFLTSVIFLQAIAYALVKGVLWLFRIFGMPQLYIWYSSLDHPGRWRFYIVLAICTISSIVRITRKKNRGNK